MAGHAVAELVGDHTDVLQAGILDGDAERGIGEVGDLELVVRHRSDHRRRAAGRARARAHRTSRGAGRGPFSRAISTPSWRPGPPRRRGSSRDRRCRLRSRRTAQRQGPATEVSMRAWMVLLGCPASYPRFPRHSNCSSRRVHADRRGSWGRLLQDAAFGLDREQRRDHGGDRGNGAECEEDLGQVRYLCRGEP